MTWLALKKMFAYRRFIHGDQILVELPRYVVFCRCIELFAQLAEKMRCRHDIESLQIIVAAFGVYVSGELFREEEGLLFFNVHGVYHGMAGLATTIETSAGQVRREVMCMGAASRMHHVLYLRQRFPGVLHFEDPGTTAFGDYNQR